MSKSKLKECIYCQTRLDKRDKDFCPFCGTSLTPDGLINTLNEINRDEIIKICGGCGEDDNMDAREDFLDTVYRMRLKLEEMGDSKPFTLISNFRVIKASKTGNHICLDNFRTEYDVIIETPWIEAWLEDNMMKDHLRMIGKKGLIVETGKYSELTLSW